ncbi:MAG: HAD family hydrolase [Nocardioides sp.]|nr:HAD family hydrolase [Nocardioides sp.]
MAIDAVIFDWGGTLTQWHDIDPRAEARALARAVPRADPADADEHAARLHRAAEVIWGRGRDQHRSATIADIFTEAGLDHDPGLLGAYRDFWAPHTETDADVRPLWEALRADGVRIGVLSNTVWPRAWHREIFERDGVHDLIDGDVYTSEIYWTKPSHEAFGAALASVGVSDPARCVFVGDRLFDDVYGAQSVGMRAIHVPHSNIPAHQIGHTEGEPDAIAQRLLEVHGLVHNWG